MKVTANSNTTADSSNDTALFSATVDTDGHWLFVDRQSDVWGRGRSLLEAFCDYWAALHSHLVVLDGERLSPRLERQTEAMRWMLSHGAEGRQSRSDSQEGVP